MDKKKISERFAGLISEDRDYKEALGIARSNSSGKIWMIGGAVYIPLLFGGGKNVKDYDFVVDGGLVEEIMVSEEYEICKNHFGGLKLLSDSMEIDLMVLSNMYQIVARSLNPTIENLLEATPLNIHSIAYDIEKNEVVGEIGLNAIKERVLRINDLEMANHWAKAYGKTLEGMFSKKASELGFECDLSGL